MQNGLIKCGPSGSVYLGGTYENSIQIGATTLTASDSTDFFVARFSPQGTPVWVLGLGGPGQDEARSLALSPYGALYVTGTLSSPLAFGATTLTPRSAFDTFLGRLTGTGPLGLPAGTAARPRVVLAPNPVVSGGVLHIGLPAEFPPLAPVVIVNSLGQRVYRGQVAGPVGNQVVQLPALAPGVYVVQASNSRTVVQQRLVVQ